MKKILIIILVLACKSYSQTTDPDPYQYFPLHIGDHWEYTKAGPDIKYTVLRDSIDMKDSSRYVFFFNPPLYYGADYRIDKNYNVFYLPQFGSWYRYKLDAKLGESWVAKPKSWAEKVIDIFQGYVFGKLTTIKTIGFYSLTNGDTVLTANSQLQYWQRLAYGFGLISEEDGAYQPMLLRGCIINGVVYGTVDVVEEPKTIPSEFILYQNYPNPFNPTTIIKYQIPKNGFVTLKVYDMLGREVATLVDEYKAAGTYNSPFSILNLPAGRHGSQFSSGVYFYQLITNNTIKTMKMILQK